MTDIDFDELDKAVNNLMGSVGKDQTDGEPKEKTFTVSDTLKPGEKPAYDKLGQAASHIGSEALVTNQERTIEDPQARTASAVPFVKDKLPLAQPQPRLQVPVARRPSNGRFMDIMSPPSNEKPSAPVGQLVVPEREKKEPEEASSPVEIATPAPVVASPPPPPPPLESAPQPAPDPSPLTPFLPDAKAMVEKRPLGEPRTPVGAVPSPFIQNAAEATTIPSDGAYVESSVNSEREPDTDGENKDNQHPIDATMIGPVQTVEAQQLQTIESEQMHHEKALSAVKDNASDAPENSKVQHPAGQKSGWRTVLIIVLIIIVFTALGAATYFILGIGV